MYSEFLGYRVNLIYCAICVAFWDIIHICIEVHDRYVRLQLYERFEELGCVNDFSKPHCEAIIVELAIYSLDLVFCIFLIFGAFAMKKVWVLAWIVLSLYHLLDFLLKFTPIFGDSIPFNAVPFILWTDLSISILGLAFVIYFFKRLHAGQSDAIVRERLANIEEITGVEFGAY